MYNKLMNNLKYYYVLINISTKTIYIHKRCK